MSTDAPPVASSATADPAVLSAADQFVGADDVAGYREARRAERRGTPVDAKPADSSSAQPADQAASTDAKPSAASEPAKGVKNADTRVQELLAERAALRAELDTLKRPARPSDATPAASSPASVAEDFPEFDAWIAKSENVGKNYTQYQRAFVRHEFDQAQAAVRDTDAKATATRERDERITAYRQSAETFIADHADYWTVVTPITSTPDSAVTEALGDVIQRSANAPALLYKLGSEIATWQRLITLPERLAVYELGRIDAALAPAAKPNPQPLTRAKEPPTTLGRKAADPADALETAVANDDVAAYRAARLRQRTAAR